MLHFVIINSSLNIITLNSLTCWMMTSQWNDYSVGVSFDLSCVDYTNNHYIILYNAHFMPASFRINCSNFIKRSSNGNCHGDRLLKSRVHLHVYIINMTGSCDIMRSYLYHNKQTVDFGSDSSL